MGLPETVIPDEGTTTTVVVAQASASIKLTLNQLLGVIEFWLRVMLMENPEVALKALAVPHRVEILRLARDEPRSVGEIAAHFAISLQAVSQHLQVLKEAGLVTEERVGTRRLYAVRPEGLAAVSAFIEQLWPDRLARLKHLAETKARHDRGE
jgi:DNA-binding transcriptional ArsR family regulator